ncbi:MAG: hypothetical protein A3D96_00700 [Chlamydiae bacterium RIFCSPHIGHO2_12_FULL_44_59]|nr:MAG: hypothetical protein A2796_00145 [Chlamydiae bacterium RIFCSPHIGHO2_01_FULL_44_39]OGN59966.1 MAG: hypothetical protein A3D96_00700 [Chlamydiae bacterium RIFCSPHIGHO2_12_FULL_44_59]OGN66181.1 MAG: hypothetical protein A2978_06025 [Chlamydiae bacterium RIFCSPLOWO2_01_FULL_44_52]OGN69085.1 MAG: hypothetical protein A3I67_07510 [Chlamydiae bacterium RIFCSPLOWO2_02_FULL_45_22]OGN69893.1 MAG: hypothetical protein A3F79_04500 [Chlamydiae bacterium RIFCSPLOWO2_12_FULL_45_20]
MDTGSVALLRDDIPPLGDANAGNSAKWRNRLIRMGLAGGAAASAVMAALTSPSQRVVGALCFTATGFCTLSSVTWQVKAPIIKQVALATLGIPTLFALSQGYYAKTTQLEYINAILFLFGGNVAVMANWLLETGGVLREEADLLPPSDRAESVPNRSCLPDKVSTGLKVGASIAATALSFFTQDPVKRGLAGFAAAFWGAQVIARFSSDYLYNKIKPSPPHSDGLHKSPWRTIYTALYTLGNIGYPLSFIPWDAAPGTERRLRQLPIVGFFAGLCAEVCRKVAYRHMQTKALTELDEFTPSPPPLNRCLAVAWRVWKYTMPVLWWIGASYFTVHECLKNSSTVPVGALVLNYLAYTTSYGLGEILKRTSRSHQASQKMDWLMRNYHQGFHPLGIPVLSLYLAIVNAVHLNGDSLKKETHPLPIFLGLTGWFFHGLSLGSESQRDLSDFPLSFQMRMPNMLLVEAATMLYLLLKGRI